MLFGRALGTLLFVNVIFIFLFDFEKGSFILIYGGRRLWDCWKIKKEPFFWAYRSHVLSQIIIVSYQYNNSNIYKCAFVQTSISIKVQNAKDCLMFVAFNEIDQSPIFIHSLWKCSTNFVFEL